VPPGDDDPERTGVLVIRAWIEPAPPGLMVRLTGCLDVLAEDDATNVSEVVYGVEAALAWVGVWLAAFLAAGGRPERTPRA
jgi:hypothetical protein